MNTSWDRSTRHRAHPKRNVLGGKGFGGNICHIFRAMENSPTSAAELKSDPDSLQLDQFPLDQQWSPLGLYHALHNHLRHPDDRQPERKGGVAVRSCSWLLTGARQRLDVYVFPWGGLRGVADFVHGKMDGMHVTVKPLRRPPSKPFHAFEHLFLLCRGFSAFWPARFSTSSRPIVIFCLKSFRLIRHDSSNFFHLCLLSLSAVQSSKERLHISFAKHINISPPASEGMRALSLCCQGGWHIRTRSRS